MHCERAVVICIARAFFGARCDHFFVCGICKDIAGIGGDESFATHRLPPL
jgi:hypothetical protein